MAAFSKTYYEISQTLCSHQIKVEPFGYNITMYSMYGMYVWHKHNYKLLITKRKHFL